MDDIYANVEKPLDNRSNRQRAGKKGDDIYANNDVILSHSTPTPNTGGTTGNLGHLHACMWLCVVLSMCIIMTVGQEYAHKSIQHTQSLYIRGLNVLQQCENMYLSRNEGIRTFSEGETRKAEELE